MDEKGFLLGQALKEKVYAIEVERILALPRMEIAKWLP
jgi:hypothetical protein